MKKIVATCLLLVSVSALSAEVDYSYCAEQFNAQGFGVFPFSIQKDGKIKTPDNVKMTTDKEKRQEILEYTSESPFNMKMKVVVTRDEKGQLSQVVQESDFKAMKTKSGIGSNSPNNFQMGFGMMGGGFGMYGNQDTNTRNVFDLKVQNGKCMVSRNYGNVTSGNHTHSALYAEAQICRDVSQFLKKNPSISSCFSDSVGKKISHLFSDHKERNKDLYENKEKPQAQEGWGGIGMGYPGAGSYGGYGMMESLDQIISTSEASIPGFGKAPIVDLIKIHKMCQIQTSASAGLISEDEKLWKKEAAAQNGDKANDTVGK